MASKRVTAEDVERAREYAQRRVAMHEQAKRGTAAEYADYIANRVLLHALAEVAVLRAVADEAREVVEYAESHARKPMRDALDKLDAFDRGESEGDDR